MGAEVIQTLVTEMAADDAKQRVVIARSNKEIEAWGKNVVSISKKVGLGLAASATGAAVGLGVMVKSSIDTADALSKQSQIVGMSIEDLSRLKHAAELSDVSFESLGTGLKKFSKNIVEAASGSKSQIEAFSLLGVSLKNSDGSLKTTSQLVGDVSDAFAKYEDGADKTAIATQLFGKAGADLIPMLNGGRQTLKDAGDEAERLGLVFDQKTGIAAENFNDNLTRLNAAMHGIANRIAQEVVPTLSDLTTEIQDPKTQEGLASIATGLVSIATDAIKATAELGNFARFLGEEMARTINGVANDDIPGLQDRLQQLQAQANPKNFMDWMENSNVGDMFTGKGKLLEEIEKVKKQIADAYSQAAVIPPPKPVEPPKQVENKKDLAVERERAAEQEKNAKLLKKFKEDEQDDIDRVMAKEDEYRKENARLVASAQDRFDQIHAAALESDNKFVELENFRFQREQADMQKDLEFLRQQGAATAEVEQQFRTAKLEQETIHQAELKKIKEDAAAADIARVDMQLSTAQDLFGSLSTITASFAGKNSRAYKAMFAMEKAISIARSIVAIQAGIAMAAANPFPANLGAIASVAGATANIVTTIKGTPSGIAHGGLDNVPKEATYLLDKGERVLSPKQNRDITDFIANDGGAKGVNVVVKNYGNDNVNVKQEGNSIEILIGQVINKIGDQISRGNGLANVLQSTYPSLNRRGTV